MAFQKTKINAELGRKVHQHLVSKGIETPADFDQVAKDPKEKIEKLEVLFQEALDILGMDRKNDSIIETPKRIAKMWVLEQYWGLVPENFPKITVVDNEFRAEEMVTVKASVNSNCEHHLLPFGSFGDQKLGAWVAYFPKDKVIGLSKLPRILDYFAHRPQIQERLTVQTAETLKFLLETDDIAVVIRAEHMCVMTRGVEDINSDTITSHLSGRFQLPEVRAEFFNFVNNR